MKKVLLLSVFMLIAAGAVFAQTATVTADALNMRASPSASGRIIKTLSRGDTLTVTGPAQNGWVPVRHGNDSGFVSADYIRISSSSGSSGGSGSSGSSRQPAAQSRIARNWISGEVSLLGAGARYEFQINPVFGVGVNAYWNTLFFLWNDFGIDAAARFYPGGKAFFVGLGLGYHQYWPLLSTLFTDTWDYNRGVALTPDIGAKIKIGKGKPSGFFISPGAKIPVTFGMRNYYWEGRRFGVSWSVVPYVGFGGAF